ncbi:DNA cytosine methyltransferase [Mucilaginibacter rubeus]|uniref:DNA (cytosine-5-)-methyltransferase n=1 Tax=Mucilaginibacter rubeus TaxID=2027860 RepID=A0A5C1I636_9SPHI|nr:DNA cytosine methyltransferase [Mucilaginibacter rubeus]QEM13409.1 DNA cytosine methyltransferase [Mucilaginibacter rubeus]
MDQPFKFYEFFCGGGMARAGLGDNWECVFANDIDEKKAETYKANWGEGEIKIDDIANIKTENLSNLADLTWASFPCQDLSSAGAGAGLEGARSGTFWPFWNLIKKLRLENRVPKIVVLENVCGALTSHEGKDFSAICSAMQKENYLFGAVVVDAVDFLPQSRPRLFFIGVQKDLIDVSFLTRTEPDSKWHTKALINAQKKLEEAAKKSWIWWNIPYPTKRKSTLLDCIEENPESVKWHSPAETQRLISLMSRANLSKLQKVKEFGKPKIGTIYKRTRKDENGNKVQRAEVRFDNISGCLRTPSGGSSRQIMIFVDNESVQSRLISARETARLMGLPDDYRLPPKYNDAYHLTGDGVVVPVVSFLSRHVLEPILLNLKKSQKAA